MQMKVDLNTLSLEELEERIRELETTYVELLQDNTDRQTLHNIWSQLNSLKRALVERKS